LINNLKNLPEKAAATRQMVSLAWRAQPVVFSGIILLTALQGFVPLATAWLTKLLFDLLAETLQAGAASRFPPELLYILGAQVGLQVFSRMLASLSGFLNAELGRKLTINIQSTIYKKISGFAGMAYFENPAFHDTLNLGTQGAQRGAADIVSTFTDMLRSIITLGSFLGVLVAFSPLLAGMVTLAALPQLYTQLKIGRQRFGLAMELSPDQRRTFYLGHILSGVHAAKEVRLFGLADYLLDKLLGTYQKVHHAQRSQEIREMRFQLSLDTLSNLVSSASFVVVVIQAFAGNLSLGDVTLYTGAVGSVQGALSGIFFAISRLNENLLFFRHFQDLMNLPQPVVIASPGRMVPSLSSAIELRGVSFRYTDEHPWVLQDVNLTIPAGQTLALVGLNGAGKTTLVKLLSRLYDPNQGQILWDGIDLREFDPQELRTHMGAIFQDFMRYDMTVQENIGLGDVNRIGSMERIRQAANKAGVQEMIDNLPQGYNTILSRWLADDGPGADLSGGEWQKIAIARMFMRSADLLILDEPTAALDAKAEYEIYTRFAELVAGRTSLLISHRFSTVRMADVIAVLEDGKITEYGAHEDLFRLGGNYAKLYAMQADRYL